MRIAVLQEPSPGGDIPRALDRLGCALRAAGAAGAALLVAPEAFLPGYNHPEIAARALRRDDDAMARAADLCRDASCGLVLGYAERDGDRLRNSAVVFDPAGREVANYRKIQLYGPRERALYEPGDAYATFEAGGLRVALLICYDAEFAPHMAALAARGVRLVCVPTANMAPFVHVVRHTIPAMAANHGLAIAYANYCGTEGDLRYVGGSQIAGPHGEVLALAGEGPALLVADLPEPDPARLSTQAADLRHLS
ncbi:nitrilase-related carbon-nitrogen hydrolase [Rubellimicrobium sp. CFH 75288]|uniref:nitrilase-related carbon-nitrogen hydrolase n=1 Tax=Rubellimicrobium sp. CFH 75288 TaxID=2697034 RepID=UPI0014120252|nr:nitrilase-related carbon-nitrogen hydrolase [Rubellimicrobium sp. CFH 75288]NAZ36195.1 nitrilase [Rubellimicrobium sp. CFH 75288]